MIINMRQLEAAASIPVVVLESFSENWEFTGNAEEDLYKLLAKYRAHPPKPEPTETEWMRQAK